jgi:hypothetical protein
MKINALPAGFVVPDQPVKAPRPQVGTDWVHESKHSQTHPRAAPGYQA